MAITWGEGRTGGRAGPIAVIVLHSLGTAAVGAAIGGITADLIALAITVGKTIALIIIGAYLIGPTAITIFLAVAIIIVVLETFRTFAITGPTDALVISLNIAFGRTTIAINIVAIITKFTGIFFAVTTGVKPAFDTVIDIAVIAIGTLFVFQTSLAADTVLTD